MGAVALLHLLEIPFTGLRGRLRRTLFNLTFLRISGSGLAFLKTRPYKFRERQILEDVSRRGSALTVALAVVSDAVG